MAEQPARPRTTGHARPACPAGESDGGPPELLEGARLLIEGRLGYEEALRSYFARPLGGIPRRCLSIFSFDGIHFAYI
jgi:hypothetical protein